MDTKDVYWNEGYGWFHIGSRQAPFSAILQGNGYVIKNLYIHLPYESKISLFSVTNNATITQLGLVGHLGSITGSTSVGSLGLAFNTGVIKTFAEAQGRQAGLLVKGARSPNVIHSYWAKDLSRQMHSSGATESTGYVGLDSSILRCAIHANTNSSNSQCVSSDGEAEGLSGPLNLFKDWDSAIWDFGTREQLPSLKFGH
jgi:hypothetical protein